MCEAFQGLVFRRKNFNLTQQNFEYSNILIMSSSDASYNSSTDSEAAETEVEYDLEVEGSSNSSEHETSDDEPGDAYANEQDGRRGMAGSI